MFFFFIRSFQLFLFFFLLFWFDFFQMEKTKTKFCCFILYRPDRLHFVRVQKVCFCQIGQKIETLMSQEIGRMKRGEKKSGRQRREAVF